MTFPQTGELGDGRALQQATIDSVPAHIAVLGGDGAILLTNSAWKRFGAENEGTGNDAARNYLVVCDAAGAEPPAAEVAAGLRAMLAGRLEQFSAEYPCHSPIEERWFRIWASHYEGPGEARLLVSHTAVTERQLAQHAVTTQNELLDEIEVAIVVTDLAGRMKYWNSFAERLYGWTRAEALGRGIAELRLTDDTAPMIEASEQLQRTGRWEGEFKARSKDGKEFPVYTHSKLIAPGPGVEATVVAITVDISERLASARALLDADNHLQAATDSMDEGLATLDEDGRVTYMNETAAKLLGFTAEELMGAVLHELTHERRPDGSVLAMADCPIYHARRDGKTVRVEDDIFTRSDGSPLPVAHTASPFATAEGVEGCALVFRDITELKKREQKLRQDAETLGTIDTITRALAEDRFVLYAQPIVAAGTGETVQRELLIRLREPDGRIVGPGAFLPVAEEYGLIGEIDRWVIRQGIELAAGGSPVELNVSGWSIGDHLMLDHIRACLERSGTDPGLIVFELTETAIVADEQGARAFAEVLHRLGCKLALDDFGTGYGSFTYLKQLPVDYLKIDVEFVRDIATNVDSRHLVEAVVGIARSFGLATVGEGVENAETFEILAALGVDFAQGYHLGRPAPLEQIAIPLPRRRRPGQK